MKPSKAVPFIVTLAVCGSSTFAVADSVAFQQPTATFSQTQGNDFNVGLAIDGTASGRGWGIQGAITSQTAAFETSADIGFAEGSILTFDLDQAFSSVPQHTLGRFRLSVTTDDRSQFADGLFSGGDVTANWTILDPISFSSANGATLTELDDHSLLASGFSPATDTYTVVASSTLTGITGIRIEAIEDSSLPAGGPGRQPENGNFVLSELRLDIAPVPEPSSLSLLATSGVAWLGLLRGRKGMARNG